MTTQTRTVHLAAGEFTKAGDRTVRGLIVPFNKPAAVGFHNLQFDADSLRVSDAARIPLLFQHNGDVTAGYATNFEITDDGVVGTFAVESTPTGDRVMREAEFGSRTGFSIGIHLDADVVEESWEKFWDGDDSPTLARGDLREVSHVSVPAFDDARISDVNDTAAASATGEASAGLAGDTTEGTTMARQLPIPAAASAARSGTLVTADAQQAPATPPAPPARAEASATPEQPATPPATAEASAPPEAGPSPFAAAQVTAEPPTYHAGGEFSFVRDAFHARFSGDSEAAARLHRFNAEIAEFAAVQSGFGEIIPPGYRGDLMVPAIDKGRPIISRLGAARITLTDATPFRLPTEGEFTGVDDHVEGTAHVAAGTLTVGEKTVNPKAVSGAFEVSRELVDSSNPAIDRIAMNAMLRDYRTKTEATAVSTYANAPAVTANGAALEGALIDFLDDRDAVPAFVAASPTYYRTMALEEAGDGRARYPYLNPQNASGTTTAGFTGLNVQGVDLVRAGQVPAGQARALMPEDLLWGESNVLTFRFDEVQGPGVIKLGLFAYVAAAVLRESGVGTYQLTA